MNKQRIIYKHINGELWCSIPEFPKHFANKKGDILGVRGKKLKKTVNKYGYETVIVMKDKTGTTKPVHRLVASCFLPVIDKEKNQIDHINGIKTDNRLENLERVTNSENQKRAVKMGLVKHRRGEKHHQSKLTANQVRDIYLSYETTTFLSKKYGVAKSTIAYIREGKIWTHVTQQLDNTDQRLNFKHGIQGLSNEDVRCIYVMEGTYENIAKQYGIVPSTVSKIKNNIICSEITKGLTPCLRGLSREEIEYIYTTNDKYEDIAKKFNKSKNYIMNIKNGYMYSEITKALKRGDSTTKRKLSKEEIIYIYTSDKSLEQLEKETGIKKTTAHAVRSGQNHKNITKHLKKGEW